MLIRYICFFYFSIIKGLWCLFIIYFKFIYLFFVVFVNVKKFLWFNVVLLIKVLLMFDFCNRFLMLFGLIELLYKICIWVVILVLYRLFSLVCIFLIVLFVICGVVVLFVLIVYIGL